MSAHRTYAETREDALRRQLDVSRHNANALRARLDKLSAQLATLVRRDDVSEELRAQLAAMSERARAL